MDEVGFKRPPPVIEWVGRMQALNYWWAACESSYFSTSFLLTQTWSVLNALSLKDSVLVDRLAILRLLYFTKNIKKIDPSARKTTHSLTSQGRGHITHHLLLTITTERKLHMCTYAVEKKAMEKRAVYVVQRVWKIWYTSLEDISFC